MKTREFGKKNLEKLKVALEKHHDIKPNNSKVSGDSRSAQTTKVVCVRQERT
jgi:hypothetical protein